MKPIEATNGEYTCSVAGKPRTFKFGMLALKLMQKNGAGVSTNIEIFAVALWAGLMCRFEQNELPAEFSVDTMLDWMDTMSDEDMAQALAISKIATDRFPNVNRLVDEKLGLLPDESPKK